MEFNDFSLIRESLQVVMKDIEASSTRYKGIVFSTENQQSLDQLVNIIRQELTEYDFWLENTDSNTPTPPVSRAIFNQMVFEDAHPGLILISPEEWMFDWKILDKRSFWSALSETYGRHVVIAVLAETSEFRKLVIDYFIQQHKQSSPFHVWKSKYQQIS